MDGSSPDGAMSLIRSALRTLVPSYLQRTGGIKNDDRRGRRSNTTALDGLRGCAAVGVFFFHILFSYTRFFEFGYGRSPEDTWWFQLPFISVLYRGHSMVAMFFVIGGYVISLKTLSLIHGHQAMAAPGSLVSTVFRRGIRLYVPATVAMFITMLTIWAGYWEYPRKFMTEDKKYIIMPDHHFPREPTFEKQFWGWVAAVQRSTDLFYYYDHGAPWMPYYPPLDPHLWTVPVEYRASLITAMVLLMFSRCKTAVRMLLVVAVTVFCGAWGRWEIVCFLSGMLLCDMDLAMQTKKLRRASRLSVIAEEDEEGFVELDDLAGDDDDDLEGDEEKVLDWGSLSASRSCDLIQSLKTILSRPHTKRWLALFVLGLYLFSSPNLDMEKTPGYMTLSTYIPSTYADKKRFLQSLGAILITWSVTNSPLLQLPFNTALAQYLGNISYSLYIVHGPIIHTIGYSVTPNMWIYVTGMEGWYYGLGLALGTLIVGVCTAWAADLFWRLVDLKAVKLARWAEDVCFVNER